MDVEVSTAPPPPERKIAPTEHKFSVFKPRFTSFKPDPTRERPSLDEVLALCLAKTPSEITATEVETLEVVPSLRGKYAEEIRAEEIKSLRDEREKEIARELAQKTLRLKDLRSNIRAERKQLKAHMAESQRVIKRMFRRFKDQGIDKHAVAPISVTRADGQTYEYAISFVGDSSVQVIDDDASEEEEEDEAAPGEDEEDAEEEKSTSFAGAGAGGGGGFIKTPPCGALSHVIHRSVVEALKKLNMEDHIGKELSAEDTKRAVWSMMSNEDFAREFMVSCIQLSRTYNEEKKIYLEQTAREKAVDAADLVKIKVEKREIGPPQPRSQQTRLSSIVSKRVSASNQVLPKPPGMKP
jgi:hypothetical protein